MLPPETVSKIQLRTTSLAAISSDAKFIAILVVINWSPIARRLTKAVRFTHGNHRHPARPFGAQKARTSILMHGKSLTPGRGINIVQRRMKIRSTKGIYILFVSL
ncbi:hypothetical protein Nepgr_006747 [Nepenthes gracilis]|uniref:Uncharacterized protein n=1 Tax=Nepenthes gracilis TaxID=150966 RepID=A0AAD3S6F1_NEPGR|nr:hypothetical protein Nepgr_006747 [Nepenthes gracilis]